MLSIGSLLPIALYGMGGEGGECTVLSWAVHWLTIALSDDDAVMMVQRVMRTSQYDYHST
jgi:hypothetical protein